jgi:hypothetical protein
MWTKSIFALLVVAVVTNAVAPPAFAAVTYRMPVSGEVVDDFRPPTNPYGAGNRGWELRVGINTIVRAPASGSVTFAGQVGGTLNVVIQHEDGVRTTLSKLDEINGAIHAGALVVAGQELGRASGGLYFGARCGSTYIDPAQLFDVEVFLVPLRGEPDRSHPPGGLCAASTVVSAGERQWLGDEVSGKSGADQGSDDIAVGNGLAGLVADLVLDAIVRLVAPASAKGAEVS